jgi:hypothetical protein
MLLLLSGWLARGSRRTVKNVIGKAILALALVETNGKGGIENAEECVDRRSFGPDDHWNLGGYTSRYDRIWFYYACVAHRSFCICAEPNQPITRSGRFGSARHPSQLRSSLVSCL